MAPLVVKLYLFDGKDKAFIIAKKLSDILCFRYSGKQRLENTSLCFIFIRHLCNNFQTKYLCLNDLIRYLNSISSIVNITLISRLLLSNLLLFLYTLHLRRSYSNVPIKRLDFFLLFIPRIIN